ncbi:MAG: NAD(P)H-hydrate dehydratase [Bacteroidia bacterium]|nr:NAD(P)H-hydrate dehydratase [Bacteroidia bacterium]
MKILNSEQIRDVDKCSIQLQKIRSWDLMERAASVFTQKIILYLNKKNTIHVFCGKGNNGGDGLAIARMLAEKSFNVKIIIIEHTSKASEDFLMNLEKIKSTGIYFRQISKKEELDSLIINNNDVCIDAILGSGINKPTEGIIKETIDFINTHYSNVYSVDVPSGLFLDEINLPENSIVTAQHTFTFQLPKLSFFFPENAHYVGNWEILDIGLSPECIEKHTTHYYTIDSNLIKKIYLKRKDISTKWDYGHALIIAGSYTMRGAAILNTGAALKSGCGMVSLHSIERVTSEVIQKYPECILSIDEGVNFCKTLPDLKKYNAIGFGSGIGVNEDTYHLLEQLLKHLNDKRLVIDADGINLIANHQECIELLKNKNIILTPHIKEFDRLFGNSKHHLERIKKSIEIAKQLGIVIVLKSAYTSIILPSEKVFINTLTNSGMAKGGSGDVLTGIIASLCARGYSIENAAILGVYLHGLAGKFASENTHPECMLPSDIISHLSKAFYYITNN